MFWIILLVLFVLFLFIYFKWFKNFKVPCVSLFTGAPKTGKTLCAVSCSIRLYKKKLFFWRIKHLFNKSLEKPLLYSNIPLKVKTGYVPLSRDLLMRESRFNYGSVILISEASLVADSMNFKDSYVNDNLTFFNKLIGHSTKGGNLIYDTQSLYDVHYSIKRVCSQYYYLVKTIKLPFFCLIKCKILDYNPDLQNVVIDSDSEDTGYWYLISKKFFKSYDRYCYSIFTDSLQKIDNYVKLKKRDSKKANYVLQIKESPYLKKGNEKND